MKFPFLLVIFVLSLAIAGGVFLFLTPAQQVAQALPVEGHCDLHVSDCHARNQAGDKSVSLALLPRQIPLMKELGVQTRLQGFVGISKVQVVVEGVNMYMGYEAATLIQDASGAWSGKLVLPVCTLETMAWQARVEISAADGAYQASFPFTTTRQ
jgi:hypothetical protein